MIDEFFKLAASCLQGAVLILLIMVAFGIILGGKRGAMWVINRAMSLVKAVLRANITMLIRLGKRLYLYVTVLLRCMGRYIYRLSRISWLPSSRIGQHQPGMRIRIQRLTTRTQDNTQERTHDPTPPDTFWE